MTRNSNGRNSSDDHAHAHDDHSRSGSRLSRIAGQLGAGMAPKYYRSGAPLASNQSSSHSSSSSSSSSQSSATDRLLSISQQLGGAVGVGSSSLATTHPHRSPNPHLTPHTDAKQWERLPRFRDLPYEGGFAGCAWSVWGEGDQLGTLNLLTDHVRARAAREEIKVRRSEGGQGMSHREGMPC